MSTAVKGRRSKVEGLRAKFMEEISGLKFAGRRPFSTFDLRLSTARCALFAASLLLVVGCDSTKGDRLMRMTRQPKYRTYETSEFWDDGRAMRMPPLGTVARESRKDLPLMDWQNADGTFKDTFPASLTVDAAFMKKGQKRFNIVCANCHGAAADGKSIPGENMALRPPPSLLTADVKARAVGYYFEVITHGNGLMPSFAGEVPVEDRWAVAAYVRALQATQGVPLTDAPASVQQNLKTAPQVPSEPTKESL